MATGWAFLQGFSDEWLDSVKTRESSDRKLREAEQLEQLRRATSDYEFNRALAQDRKEVKRQSFDPTTGETIDFNTEGTEIGRRRDPAALDEYQRNQEMFDLKKRDIESGIRARTEESAYRRAALALRSADGDSDGGDGKSKRDKSIFAANQTQKNLEQFGFTGKEMAAARVELLRGIEKGWNPSQFATFERVFLEDQVKRGRVGTLSDAAVAEEIFGKTGSRD
jgi:hypothetical protein